MDSQLKQIDSLKDSILPFLLGVGFNGKIMSIGKSLLKLIGSDIHNSHVDDYFEFNHPKLFSECLKITNENKLVKAKIINKPFELKGNAHIFNAEEIVLFLFIPVYNDQQTLASSGLSLSDFPDNSVMAEYLFLIEQNKNNLENQHNIIKNLEAKTKALQNSLAKMEELSKLPEENPNPVVRISDKGVVIYGNDSAKESFLELLDLKLNEVVPDSFNLLLNQAYSSREGIFDKIIELNKHTYSITIIKVPQENYFNLYALEITNSKKEISQEKNQLKKLQDELALSKDNLEKTINNQQAEITLNQQGLAQSLKEAALLQNIFFGNNSSINNLTVFSKPKHIASADFFVIEKIEDSNFTYIALGDCLGNDLKGAFLSVFFANQIKNTIKSEAVDSSLISIFNSIEKNVSTSDFYTNVDHFCATDLTILRINKANHEISFASNNYNLVSFDSSSNNIYEPTNDKLFATVNSAINNKKIVSGTFNAQNKYVILFSDGIINQFGGEKLKKLKRRYLYSWIASGKVFKDEQCLIEQLFTDFKANQPQTDDCIWLSFKL